MARKIVINKNELKIKLILIFVLALVLGVSVIFSKPIEKLLHIGVTHKSGKYVSVETLKSSDMTVHYIDVGQADCTLLQLPDSTTMLIDAGDIETRNVVVNYIKGLNITTINYFVLTHSDSDHVGGAKTILENFEVQNIYRPFAIAGTYVGSSTALANFTPNSSEDLGAIFTKLRSEDDSLISKLPRVKTKVYSDTISAVYAETYTDESGNTKPSNVSVNYDGLTIASTDNTKKFEIEFYAPLKNDANLELISDYTPRTSGYLTKGYGATTAQGFNAVSPVIRVEYLNNKFLFTGDIYDTAEKDVVNSLTPEDIKELSNITVYQAGHHGASNSNSSELLNIINPTYTIVSVGEGNTYGHPTEEFLNRINGLHHDITDYLLRTDKQGTIAFGIFNNGEVKYSAGVEITNTVFEVAWWQIAVGIFVVGSVIIISIRYYPKKKKRKK